MSEEGMKLKRFHDALRGRRLSGIAAYQINQALCGAGPYREHCSQDEKLPGIHKERLQQIVQDMEQRGVVAPYSLLTPCQQKALQKKDAKHRRIAAEQGVAKGEIC